MLNCCYVDFKNVCLLHNSLFIFGFDATADAKSNVNFFLYLQTTFRLAVVLFALEYETFLFSTALSTAMRYNQLLTQWVQEITLWARGWGGAG